MTQRDRIREYMLEWGDITPFDAFRDLGVTKLATRIGEMIREGDRIKKETVTGTNRYGDKIHYTRYMFEEVQPDGSENP